MEIVLFWFQALLLLYFLYVSTYTFIFALAGFFYKSPLRKCKTSKKGKFAVLIPAYKEDAVIVEVARRALNQNYDSELYDVVVIADSLKETTLNSLGELPVKVIKVSFEKSTKVKALNVALKELKAENYDFATILDADNLMDKDFIFSLNLLHQNGYKAVQGRRAAKNKNNELSLLDGLSEEFNNSIYGKGSTALGLSSSLKGSGMSFDFKILYELLSNMDSIGGFDRELEVKLIEKGIRVMHVHDAVVYDEKVEKAEVFENQRKRWISSQYVYLRKYFFKGIKSLFSARIVYFNSTVLRNIQLPRLINLGLLFIFTTLFTLIPFLSLGILIPVWLGVSSLMVFAILLSIPAEYLNIKLFYAILRLPSVFLRMILLLFRIKGANKKFIHTPHGSDLEGQTK